MGHDTEFTPGGNLLAIKTAQRKNNYDSLAMRAAWTRSADAARSVWSKLPYNDLIQTGGEPQKLIALLEKHYELGEGEAARQVNEFLEHCRLIS